MVSASTPRVDADSQPNTLTKHISLDLPACGMRALYYWGVYRGLLDEDGIVIDRVYGRSSGAIIGACICAGIGVERCLELYERVQQYHKPPLLIVDAYCRVLQDVLPADAYTRCTGRLHVTCSLLGLFPSTTSIFHSNEHLIDTIRSSGYIPWLTSNHAMSYSPWGLPQLDGGCTDMWYTHDFVPSCCGGPFDSTCGHTEHILSLQADRHSWPDRYLPLYTNHEAHHVQHAQHMGHEQFKSFLDNTGKQPSVNHCFRWMVIGKGA